MPDITVICEIDAAKYPWCDSAVLLRVINGKAALTRRCGEEDENYYAIFSQILLNGKPLVQATLPVCPTCSGLLAAGYGIENISCAEVEQVRQTVNGGFTDIRAAAEQLSPLLGLLSDGYYVLADVPHYPTDGEGRFFYDVPNELTSMYAACDSFYDHELITSVNSFPAYLYPTQSDELLNDERVQYYVDEFRCGKKPHGIAYHEAGFISALLDGHHKAAAAAQLGIPLNYLTIIGMTGKSCRFDVNTREKIEQTACFSALSIDASQLDESHQFSARKQGLQPEEFRLITGKALRYRGKSKIYPTLSELTGIYAADLQFTQITDELIESKINSNSSDDHAEIRKVMEYNRFHDPDLAERIARKIIAADRHDLPNREAFKTLLRNKSPENEQIFLDYIVAHSPGDECWDIVNAYWDK